ncbi:membrane frizzled-related protein-like [Ciona intestinalis]
MQLLHRVKLFRFLEIAAFLLLQPIYAQDCRRTINVTGTPQVMTSPGWPRHYRNNMDCRWDLNVAPGSRMRIQFTNISTQECCDRVQIFDPGHPFIYTLSGNITDINLQSKAPRLTVRFRTDGSVTSYGFFATVVETVTSQVVPTTTPPPAVSCGYNATATESPQ